MNRLPCSLALLGIAAAFFALPTPGSDAAPRTGGMVVRPAPQFTLNTGKTLRQYRGQPVVILVAPDPRSRSFRRQVKRLERDYGRFAARKAIFVAAFTNNPSGEGVKSNIPFVYAQDGVALCQHYGANPNFSLLMVGTDGNLDLVTSRITDARRAFDVIVNNGTLQQQERQSL